MLLQLSAAEEQTDRYTVYGMAALCQIGSPKLFLEKFSYFKKYIGLINYGFSARPGTFNVLKTYVTGVGIGKVRPSSI